MRKVSKENPIPLYYQLKEILQEMIENEELKHGDLIPTERELCEIQNISRMTARKAIMALVNEGLLYREQGKGTYVSEPKINQPLSELSKGFTEALVKRGLKSYTKILSFEVKDATLENRRQLNLMENEKVIELKRLRIVEEEPFGVEHVCIPYRLCEDLTREMLEGKSLYVVLKEKYGYCPESTKQTIEPIKVNEYKGELLNLENDDLALLVKGTAYLSDGTAMEYTKATFRCDKYKYEIRLK
ncbi:GntR family transcriptional regulator [Clostridium sp. ZS2-4]|uniref:GntR family transcriptional regulator n=1 Tax=Clostridium sp. ZS2-4 TaxID=2987703 RepID=UPI00227BA982|nr:GntR family transcriptional regulator [Clostridium sp. ZS2-4]MCY6356526.1 GntR family transcriptional regulator [Clostridium sp. ZS2-4]